MGKKRAIDDPRVALLTVQMAEYSALRAQILEQVKAVYLVFGTAATLFAGALAAGTLTWNQAIVSTTIFNIVLPLCLLISGIGLAFGAKDMAALGNYIRESIEERLDVLWGADLESLLETTGHSEGPSSARLLGWERSLRDRPGGKHLLIDGNIGIFFLVFLILFGATSMLGFLRVLTDAGWGLYPREARWALALFPLATLLVLAVTALVIYRRSRMLNVTRRAPLATFLYHTDGGSAESPRLNGGPRSGLHRDGGAARKGRARVK